MKTAYMSIEALKRADDGLSWRPANVTGWKTFLRTVGMPAPILINAATKHILTPPGMLEALHALMHEHADPPGGVHVIDGKWNVLVVGVRIDPSLESLAMLALAGGVDRGLTPGLMDKSIIDVLLSTGERSLELIPAAGISIEDYSVVLDALLDESPAQSGNVATSPPLQMTYNMPTLNAALQGEFTPRVMRWGQKARGTRFDGLIHFYTDDSRFRRLLDQPDDLLTTGCAAIIEPNFSTTDTMPYAVALHKIYQKRKLARYWQDRGVRVFVDMNVDRTWRDVMLLGVPSGWRAYANRAYTSDMEHLDEMYLLARQHAGGEVVYLVYGGGKKVSQLCEARGWHWIPEESDLVRGKAVNGTQAT